MYIMYTQYMSRGFSFGFSECSVGKGNDNYFHKKYYLHYYYEWLILGSFCH